MPDLKIDPPKYIWIPVRTTDAVKEPHLRGRDGHVLVGHPHTDMMHNFIVELPGEPHLLQCGPWEIELRDEGGPA